MQYDVIQFYKIFHVIFYLPCYSLHFSI